MGGTKARKFWGYKACPGTTNSLLVCGRGISNGSPPLSRFFLYRAHGLSPSRRHSLFRGLPLSGRITATNQEPLRGVSLVNKPEGARWEYPFGTVISPKNNFTLRRNFPYSTDNTSIHSHDKTIFRSSPTPLFLWVSVPRLSNALCMGPIWENHSRLRHKKIYAAI